MVSRSVLNSRVKQVFKKATDQSSTFDRRDLWFVAQSLSSSDAERKALIKAVLDNPELLKLSQPGDNAFSGYFTTRAARAEEESLIAVASHLVQTSLRDRIRHFVSHLKPRAFNRSVQSLGDDQKVALNHALAGGSLKIINGKAGTGKSTTMSAIRSAFEKSGKSVIGLAPTNLVVRDMRSSGFKSAKTIHLERYQLESGQSQWSKDTIVIIDEASMVDTGHLLAILSAAEKTKASIVLIGDNNQLQAIGRSGMFGVFLKQFGSAELSVNHRQR